MDDGCLKLRDWLLLVVNLFTGNMNLKKYL